MTEEIAAEAMERRIRAIDVLGALSIAADLSLGLPAGHGVRATYIGDHIADELRLPPQDRTDLFYAELLMDAGCTAWASQVAATILGDETAARRQLFFFSDPHHPADVVRWLARYMAASEAIPVRVWRSAGFALNGREFLVEGLRNSSEVAARLARRLDRSPRVQETLRNAFERWDGSGPSQRRGDSIPLGARIVYASIFLEVYHRAEGRQAALSLAQTRRGKTLDPNVVDAFLRRSADEGFWRGLESEAVWELVRGMEPESEDRFLAASRLDDAARAFGDFADLKSFYSAGHARRVARLAESIASAMRLEPSEVTTIRRAALLHDIGMAAVPSFVLHKPEKELSDAEWETLRLHPYHGERIAGRVAEFAPTRPMIAAHHERPDGRGYPHGLRGDEIPLGARIIAAADRFDELTHAGPARAALAPDEVLLEMDRESGTALFPDVLSALRGVVPGTTTDEHLPLEAHGRGSPARRRGAWPGELTDREVQVLRAVATGASRRAIAVQLSLSEHTVRHHLEHIYSKIEVRTRVEATLFAMEHGLLP